MKKESALSSMLRWFGVKNDKTGNAGNAKPPAEEISVRHLLGSETVPDPVPPQPYTLWFLGVLVAITYVVFIVMALTYF